MSRVFEAGVHLAKDVPNKQSGLGCGILAEATCKDRLRRVA